MNIQVQGFSPQNYSDKNILSTPKFQGFKYLKKKYNNESEKIENKINNSSPIKVVKKRINLSEKKREMKDSMTFIINSSTEKVNYTNSLLYNYQIKKENNEENVKRQLSFDEKSENYFFSNENNNINNTNNNNKNIKDGSLKSNNKKKEKKEKDESFNYDLPLEMDKTSDIFNYNNSTQDNSNNCNHITKFQEYNNILLNLINNDKNGNKITVNYKQKTNNNNENKAKKIENNKQYFSFDGENQINNSNKEKGDILKGNNDKKKNMNKIKNNILSLLQNDNKDITDTNNTIENEISANYISENNIVNKEKEKEKKSNKINNKIIKRLISTPKKECETNFKLILM